MKDIFERAKKIATERANDILNRLEEGDFSFMPGQDKTATDAEQRVQAAAEATETALREYIALREDHLRLDQLRQQAHQQSIEALKRGDDEAMRRYLKQTIGYEERLTRLQVTIDGAQVKRAAAMQKFERAEKAAAKAAEEAAVEIEEL